METSKQRARRWVHKSAVAGSALALIPVPGTTTATLIALETYMVIEICKIYRHEGREEIIAALALEAGVSVGLKAIAEALTFAGPLGWLVKPAVAATFIELLGNTIIAILEKRYPDRVYITNADVEAGLKSAGG